MPNIQLQIPVPLYAGWFGQPIQDSGIALLSLLQNIICKYFGFIHAVVLQYPDDVWFSQL